MAEQWNEDELGAAVEAYRWMQQAELERRAYSKREKFRDLVSRFGRTTGAWDYRMQNISAILQADEEPWIAGFKPATNVGRQVEGRLRALLSRRRLKPVKGEQAAYKTKLPHLRAWLINVARIEGTLRYGDIMNALGLDRYSLKFALRYIGHQCENLEEPILTALVVNKKTGECSGGIEREFGIDPVDERRRLFDYWREHAEEALPQRTDDDLATRAARFVSVEARPEQAAFRRRVFLAYGGRCVITGCDVVEALDAAHKQGRDWRSGNNRAEDGVLLRKDLHALFDAGLLILREDGAVTVASAATGHYGQFSAAKWA
ncbi:MAG TPA: HNH endonuclease signature motif containing protein [Dokdonella sp.]|uniref:HNH endonuclease n=1 Tax=Dokdonella sp. TaxID=2291710 RepID=UPI002CA360DE|nr:HNH endonuclease signature motif containing protein [Dokdonella sp.]HUD40998.1 HNH endonuclease signature motif containing protein [Dokdonella sp.]